MNELKTNWRFWVLLGALAVMQCRVESELDRIRSYADSASANAANAAQEAQNAADECESGHRRR